jgi:hypothetical protein
MAMEFLTLRLVHKPAKEFLPPDLVAAHAYQQPDLPALLKQAFSEHKIRNIHLTGKPSARRLPEDAREGFVITRSFSPSKRDGESDIISVFRIGVEQGSPAWQHYVEESKVISGAYTLNESAAAPLCSILQTIMPGIDKNSTEENLKHAIKQSINNRASAIELSTANRNLRER